MQTPPGVCTAHTVLLLRSSQGVLPTSTYQTCQKSLLYLPKASTAWARACMSFTSYITSRRFRVCKALWSPSVFLPILHRGLGHAAVCCLGAAGRFCWGWDCSGSLADGQAQMPFSGQKV